MNTTLPIQAVEAARGWVLYDGDCPLCTRSVQRFAEVLRRRGFDLAPLQTAWVREQFGVVVKVPPEEMIVITPEQKILGGADGVVQIARRIWWAWPLFALAQIPGTMILLRAIYRRVAANRYCLNGACEITRQHHFGEWLLLIVLPVLTLFLRNLLPAWIFMWALAFAIYFGCKWLTWRRATRTVPATQLLSLGYLFGWVGMDAGKFLRRDAEIPVPKLRDWFFATIKTIAGAILIWVIVRQFILTQPLVAGWIGMVGIILCLHFGLFKLLSLAWQRAGVDAMPIMCEPLRATSLTVFWGRRWNGAFHLLANDFIFRPMLRRYGVMISTLAVFLISGLIHDLLISLPARGGFGLPTAYFLIQGLGVIFERTRFARWIGLGRGVRGWLFTAVCTVVPAFWLFHPAFVINVILPMLHAIGAT